MNDLHQRMKPEELYEQNQKLVGYCFKKIICKPEQVEDVLQEGRLGLWMACLDFQPELGNAFSTYAVPRIWGQMMLYLRNSHPIHFPRPDLDSKEYRNVSFVSLDQPVDEENSTEFHSIIGGYSDDYPYITEDLIESFLKTIEIDRDRDLIEEWLYSSIWFEPPSQMYLADKYRMSQPKVSRLISKYRKKFSEFISNSV